MNERKLYDSGRVARFHTLADYTHTPRQSVAEHSWGVALMVLLLCDRARVIPSPGLLRAAILHDSEESITGDLPSTTKWRFGDYLREPLITIEQAARADLGIADLYQGLEDHDALILVWADALELLAYTYARQGELAYKQVHDTIAQYMLNELTPFPEGLQLMAKFTQHRPRGFTEEL